MSGFFVMSEFNLLRKLASFVYSQEIAPGIPFTPEYFHSLNPDKQDQFLSEVRDKMRNSMNTENFRSEEEREQAVEQMFRLFKAKLLNQQTLTPATKPMKLPPTPPPEAVENINRKRKKYTPEEIDERRRQLNLPKNVPIAMPENTPKPKTYHGPPAKRRLQRDELKEVRRNERGERMFQLNSIQSWFDKFAVQDNEVIGQLGTFSGREVRVMSYFYDHAAMSDFMIIKYLDNNSFDRVQAGEVKIIR